MTHPFANSSTATVSKSRYLQGLQCPKLLWNACNAPHLLPARDSQALAIFDQGKEVGNLAKQLFPGGIDFSSSVDVYDCERVLIDTEQALSLRRPLFEAAFVYEG